MDHAGAAIRRRPFERPWMSDYIDRRLEVDNSATCSLLGWSIHPRHGMEKRFPFLIERLRSEPLEWHARNQAAMRKDARRPNLRLYKSLIAVESEVVETIERFLHSPAGEALPRFRRLDASEFRWVVRLLYRLLLTSVQMSNRMLILNYLEVTCRDRFRAGFTPEEICRLLEELDRVVLAALRPRPEMKELEPLLYEQITVPLEFGAEEVREQHERFEEEPSPPAEPAPAAGGLTPRETLEQTIWSCLVQRK
jgi:hypothetical protein